MQSPHTLDLLIERYETRDKIKFLFFWGNAANGSEITKACLSQWYDSAFTADDIIYKTSEHWMMAQKALLFNDTQSFEKIIQSNKPGEAKDLGREVKGFIPDIWESKRFDIVVTGNIYKFSQNPELRNFLLNTKDRVLVEASPVDTVWGVGLSADDDAINNPKLWRGPNLLGFALMKTRDILSQDNTSK